MSLNSLSSRTPAGLHWKLRCHHIYTIDSYLCCNTHSSFQYFSVAFNAEHIHDVLQTFSVSLFMILNLIGWVALGLVHMPCTSFPVHHCWSVWLRPPSGVPVRSPKPANVKPPQSGSPDASLCQGRTLGPSWWDVFAGCSSTGCGTIGVGFDGRGAVSDGGELPYWSTQEQCGGAQSWAPTFTVPSALQVVGLSAGPLGAPG